MPIHINPVTPEEYEQYLKTPDIENSVASRVVKEVNNIIAIVFSFCLLDLIQDEKRYVNGPDDEAYDEIDRLKEGIIQVGIPKSEKIAYARRLAYLQDKPTGIGRFKNFCNRVVRVVLLTPKILAATFIAFSILFVKDEAEKLYRERKIADIIGYTPSFLKNGRRSLDELNDLISSVENPVYKPETLSQDELDSLRKTFARS
ncbi:MAG: hypothetical protein FJZ60_01395 [Chlamydiae bacterium]|nr:hypothetical protein [Chlamydiota bacterium]